MDGEWEFLYADEVEEYVSENGISNIDEFFKEKLEGWQDVEVNIGVTGDSGTGKSSFINTIRELDDDDDQAAKVGVTETTMEPKCYDHPSNPKIKFYDLPGIGTPKFPDLDSYCRETNLEKYHTFLIFTSSRFTKNDLILAQKIRSLEKKFFFVRTKIDDNVRAERRKKSFNEAAMLEKIRDDCSENLSHLIEKSQDVFLISNHDPSKWDFDRLTNAILDVLPTRQKEAMTMTLGVLTTLSKDLLKRKVKVLQGRMWMIAGASAAGALVPIPGLSIAVDQVLIYNEVMFYKSQLGIPDEGSEKFKVLRADTQQHIQRTCISFSQVFTLLSAFAVESAVEEVASFIPVIGSAIAGTMSYSATYLMLKKYLGEMEELALQILEEAALSSERDLLLD
ncbi:interferon-inducible GTPase 5 isoform X1 [Exaiptasia diaphana]|uniref:IRG-type G domain-containing protein n=1 Tax=Exaiptasia diaphana TaxID=2652724 RepID=A0A913XPZ2_EXADI|nr:interferon-inducible GTPase 5 isoform X1 [Exaiptasia diaphana]KXJ25236.1 Interferon-inducible GTPase 5 [Exaiptasia diaphana]